MIKTIKVKKSLRLDELLKYVWDNKHKSREYYSKDGILVDFTNDGDLSTDFFVSKDEVFTVEIEEYISDKKVFPTTLTLHENGTLKEHWNRSIESLKAGYPYAVQIHAVINRKLELIWESEENASI